MSSNLSPLQFSDVSAHQVQVGDRLDASGKTRVTQTHPRNDDILMATQTRGARSGSIRKHHKDETVRVWRKA